MIYLYQILFLVFTYFICAIPFGLLLAKIFKGQDIRQIGSGNIGATNVLRVCGKKLGAATLILDGIKGAIMIIIARSIFTDATFLNKFLVLIGIIAVLAHIFPIYLNFKGGKGVATSIAVLLAIAPITGLLCVAAWIIIFGFTKTASIASMAAILITAGFTLYSHSPFEEILLAIFLTALIFFRHKENITRILNGTEPQFKRRDDNITQR